MKTLYGKLNIFRKRENGSAALVEAALILPGVFVTVLALILLCFYGFESCALYSTAERLAVLAAKEAAVDGYEVFWQKGGLTAKTDFDWPEHYVPGRATVEAILSRRDPYRYWQDFQVDEASLNMIQSILWENKLINTLSSGEQASTCYTVLTNPTQLRIYVTVNKQVTLPRFFRVFGLNNLFDIHVESVAVVNAPSAFARNADTVARLSADKAWTNLHIDQTEDSIERKVTLLRERLFRSKQRIGG